MSYFKTKTFLFLQNKFGIHFRRKSLDYILDKPYHTIQGTIRKEDYDDGWLLALAHEAENIFDVGCNMGQSSLILLYPDRVKNIVLIDPNPTALSICAENLILNNLSHKARFVCAFASRKSNDKVTFYTVGAGAAGSMYAKHAVTASSVKSSMEVPTISLDY